MKKLTESQIERAKYLEESKCQEEGCYNFAEQGYIYCIGHLHGFSPRMSTEDIILLDIYLNQINNAQKKNEK